MTGRVKLERGRGSVTLTLAHWNLSREAVLTDDEARALLARLNELLSQPQPGHGITRLPDIL